MEPAGRLAGQDERERKKQGRPGPFLVHDVTGAGGDVRHREDEPCPEAGQSGPMKRPGRHAGRAQGRDGPGPQDPVPGRKEGGREDPGRDDDRGPDHQVGTEHAGPGVFGPDLMVGASIVIAAGILAAALLAPRHGVLGARPVPSLRPPGVPPRSFHWARLACLGTGLVFAVADIASGAGHIMNEKGAGAPLLLAFAFVLAGEAAGRLHFYGCLLYTSDAADE